MSKRALLVVSFGTSHEDTRQSTIGAVEQQLQGAFAGWQMERAYTSPPIRRILAGRGQPVPSPEEALDALAAQGVEQVLVQPTHLICGEEYHKLLRCVGKRAAAFRRVTVGKPLLCEPADYQQVAELVAAWLPAAPGEALVLMGHGTPHPMNAAYPAMDSVFRNLGHDHVFVGTVEGWPSGADILHRVRKAGYGSVLLAPLMLVAGDHAKNDMAGAEGSWKSLFEQAGLGVRCRLQGLGECPGVQQMYVQHALKALEE